MSFAPTGLRTAGRPRDPSTFSVIVSALLTSMGKWITLWANRRAVYRLSALDDRFLQDIGVTRADIFWALSHPWRIDPSKALAGRIERRKSAVRWARRF